MAVTHARSLYAEHTLVLTAHVSHRLLPAAVLLTAAVSHEYVGVRSCRASPLAASWCGVAPLASFERPSACLAPLLASVQSLSASSRECDDDEGDVEAGEWSDDDSDWAAALGSEGKKRRVELLALLALLRAHSSGSCCGVLRERS